MDKMLIECGGVCIQLYSPMRSGWYGDVVRGVGSLKVVVVVVVVVYYVDRGRAHSYQAPTLSGCPPTCIEPAQSTTDDLLPVRDELGRLGLAIAATGEGVLQSSDAGEDASDEDAELSAGG